MFVTETESTGTDVISVLLYFAVLCFFVLNLKSKETLYNLEPSYEFVESYYRNVMQLICEIYQLHSGNDSVPVVIQVKHAVGNGIQPHSGNCGADQSNDMAH